MQVSSDSAVSLHDSFDSSVTGKFEEDFRLKLNVNDDRVEEKIPIEDDDEEVGEEEEEFSFVCTNPDGSPISADDIFQDGQILPFYPLFDKDLRQQLEKVFVEERDGDCGSSVSSSEDTEGLYCPWTKKAVEESEKACRKSNSTGFSKLRRFRELIHRSRSDGKDAFVFLRHDHHNHHSRNPDSSVIATATMSNKPANKVEKSENVTEGKSSKKPPRSAHERLYVQNRATKEEHKRKTYLPYRVGFFTTNVHPY
ncbi:uncharacterized protein [Euphorbia lathyris]|uniref:uncharacterized protein n=1 Tax=Euphorbia lathyris TaxID=212925 RepID=UPI003313B58F